MRTLAVVNMKGGVGKTTTAVQIAAGLRARGRRVLLVDADPQGNVGNLLGLSSPHTIREVMLGEVAPAEAIIEVDSRPGLGVIVSTPAAFTLETVLAGTVQRETLLSRRMKDLHGFDVMVIDSSPAMNLLTYNALLCVGEIVMPVGMDTMALAGARQTLNGVNEIRSLWPDRQLTLAAVVPTAVNMNTHASRATLQALAADKEMGPALFERGIRQCIDLTYAAAAHQTIWEYAPASRAAEDYSALVAQLDGAQTIETETTYGEKAQAGIQPSIH
ncbi:MAG: ParA family protein [Acidimicrobiia bacterium]|nr:ParA family protein [Acidimicrobiia bacterium]